MTGPELHVISNGKKTLKEFTAIAMQIFPYVTAIHIREKNRSEEEISKWVDALAQAGLPKRKIVVNSHVALAARKGAGGVHLPAESPASQEIKNRFPNVRIGRSVHSLEEAAAARHDADYLFFGNVFETASKPGVSPKGLSALRQITQNTMLPVIAIGGIKPGNVPEVLQAGISGIAVMSGVFEANDPLHAVFTYRNSLNQGGGCL